MRVLIVAVSARMLAQLAVADGHDVIALDRFGDADLRAVAPGATAAGSDALAGLADGVDADALVYGAGFENRPDLVARLARGRELLGTAPESLAAVRDPWAVGAAARAAGARAPETRGADDLPRQDPGAWLRKPARGGGGRGVRAWAGGRLAGSEIAQRRIHGLACSAVAIGDGRRALVVGLTEQLHRGRSFQWMGNAAPPRLAPSELAELGGQLGAVCEEVAARFGVRGAFGVDAVWDGRHAWVLEVNPRPPASLELFGPGCFAAHVRGARGEAGPAGAARAPAAARAAAAAAAAAARVKLVLYAPRDLTAPAPVWWPAGLVHDIPKAGEEIRRGAPVCTLISGGSVPEVTQRGAELLAALTEAVPVGA